MSLTFQGLLFPDTETEIIKIIKNIVVKNGWTNINVGRKRLTPQQNQKDTQIVVISQPGSEVFSATHKQDLVLVNVYSKDLETASVISRTLARDLQNSPKNPVSRIRLNSNPARTEFEGEETFYASNYFVLLKGIK